MSSRGVHSLSYHLLHHFFLSNAYVDLQSLGPKKVAFLWKAFKAGTVEEVEALARDGKLRDLPGFGEKSEENILKATEVFKKSAGRFLIDVAAAEAIERVIR